jgi:hypothetical protein
MRTLSSAFSLHLGPLTLSTAASGALLFTAAAALPATAATASVVNAAALPPDAASLEAQAEWPAASPDLRLRVWLPEQIRRVRPASAHIEVYHDGGVQSVVQVESIALRIAGREMARRPVDLRLRGDDGLYGELVQLAELVPASESKRYAHRQVPLTAHRAFDAAELELMSDELQQLGTTLAARHSDAPSMGLLEIGVDLPALLGADAAPGARVELEFEVGYLDAHGRHRSARVSHMVQVIPPFPRQPLPAGGNAALPLGTLAGAWYTGDLHMHDCKDETGFWRGCPTCQAESLNWGDDNPLSRLKIQYDTLGADWFTSTSHSYCLENANEYEQVRADVAALNEEGGVLIIPDTELTSAESGPRQGCLDLNDIICAVDGGVNHIGAHFISTWKAGGKDIGGGYCYNPIYEVLENIDAIRGEGGFVIMNHPCVDPVLGGALTSNSDAVLTGIRQGGLQGAEIWNGSSETPGHAAWWSKRLLEGNKLYCYSGSDTHDDAFNFGWNHVYVWPTLTSATLQRSLQMGLLYVSSYQYLALAAREPGQAWVPMGSDLSVPGASGDHDLEVVIAFDMGDRSGGVELYRGRVGDSGETLLASFEEVTGSGYLFASDTAPSDRGSYYRAYSTAPGSPRGVAYSNPVWIEPSE